MVVLASAVIDRVMRKTRRSTQLTTLDGAISGVATDITLQSVEFIAAPTFLEIDSEVISVVSVDASSRIASVIRGFLGTQPVAHSNGEAVFISPEFLRQDILDLINECLDDLYPTLFRLSTNDLVSSDSVGYELTADVSKPLAVWGQNDSSGFGWKPIGDWEFFPQADITDFPSGAALMIRASLPRGAKVRVIHATPFAPISAEADDIVGVSGIQPYMSDLPFYYAIAYTLAERENQRSRITSGQTHQRSQDVPAFSALQTANWYRARYDEKKQEAAYRQQLETRKIVRTGYGT